MAFKNSQDYKYNLYISASKLRMLYEQVSAATSKKRTFAWGVNLKVATIKSSSTKEKPDREEMLKRVVEGLEASGQLGSLAEPKNFIRDTFPIRWGFYNDCHSRPEDEPALVYFGGFENGRSEGTDHSAWPLAHTLCHLTPISRSCRGG